MVFIKGSCALLALATVADAKAISGRGAGSYEPTICNRAWSNSGGHHHTDCRGADWIFSTASDTSDVVRAGLSSSSVTSMAYLSVGTVNPHHPADPRLTKYVWHSNGDDNGHGGTWGDSWFDPNDLVPKILPIMRDVMDKYKGMGYDAISTDNANPSQTVADYDSKAADARAEESIDSRYIEYMHGIVDYAHSIGLKVALKNPSYYTHVSSLIGKFDAFIVESMFNWYPSDIKNYNHHPNLLTGRAPLWDFQYQGVNGLSDSELRQHMKEQHVDMVYMDHSSGWKKFYADESR